MRIAAILAAVSLLAACSKQGPGPGEARITGSFTIPVPGYVNITAGPVLDSARINRDGEFSIDVPVKDPVRAILFFGNRLTGIYLEPGKEITLKMSPVVFPEEISYGGSLGPVNHYLNLSAKLDQQTSIPANDLFGKDPHDFLRFMDSTRKLKIRLLDEYAAKYSEIDPAFVSLTRREIDYNWADQHLQYPINNLILKGIPAELPAGFHPDYPSRFDLNSTDNLASPAFKSFIQNYLDYRQDAYLTEHPETASLIFPESIARFRLIHNEFAGQEVIDYLLFTSMTDHLANYGTTKVESFLTDFRMKCRNREYLDQVETLVKGLDKVALGQPAADFPVYTADGRKVSFSDYFGQLTYVGFWASWSEWSIREIPYFEQLRKDFSGKPVRFIMVSLDFEKDRNRWEAIIKKNGFGSIQLMQDPRSTVLKDVYYLNDFPRYFLIDSQGKIISAFAPRPTENIAETLNRILKKEGQI